MAAVMEAGGFLAAGYQYVNIDGTLEVLGLRFRKELTDMRAIAAQIT